jgi:hypothetical protein
MVYFDNRIPNLYSGEMDTVDILVWMTEQVTRKANVIYPSQTEGSHIEAVSVEILTMLVRKHDDITVFFYDSSVRQERSADNPDHWSHSPACRMLLEELEHVDHILEAEGITLVKVDDPAAAEKFSVDIIPAIVHYQVNQPTLRSIHTVPSFSSSSPTSTRAT